MHDNMGGMSLDLKVSTSSASSRCDYMASFKVLKFACFPVLSDDRVTARYAVFEVLHKHLYASWSGGQLQHVNMTGQVGHLTGL